MTGNYDSVRVEWKANLCSAEKKKFPEGFLDKQVCVEFWKALSFLQCVCILSPCCLVVIDS